MKVAIFGLGRSGLAVAEAVVRAGGKATVYDEKTRESIPKRELVDDAERLGASLNLGNPFPSMLPAFDFVVANPAIDHRHPALQALSKSGHEVISEVEFAYRISKAPIIGITGSNGKSTTTAMTTVALQAAGKDAILCGNIFGSGLPEQPLTQAAMNSTPDQVLVAEISSFQLEWVSKLRPIAAAITSLSPDHQDRYDSYEQYCDTKKRIFAAQTSEDLAVIPEGVSIRSSSSQLQLGKDILVRDRHLVVAGVEVPVDEFSILGEHNWLNAGVAACLASRGLGSPNVNGDLLAALKQFKGLTHRMEFVAEHRGVRFINNSMCTNPAAVIASLKNIGAKTHVLVGGLNKDLHFEALGDFLKANQHEAYLFGKDAEQISLELKGNYPIWSTMKQAFDAATQGAKEGEIVMLAPGCASSDQFSDFRHRGDVFKTYVTDWTA
ncbi:MAG TPA: UDP-N-acetylmuramoyl-L-alanine--D-glutamate ligase [Fimbriimonas sp.]|nr:UDP-N-acetylmuramoyl-L-alanine--D-glutamate ligase [Fimbriimonas sp.]